MNVQFGIKTDYGEDIRTTRVWLCRVLKLVEMKLEFFWWYRVRYILQDCYQNCWSIAHIMF